MANGSNGTYDNDLTIPNNEHLYRRIFPGWWILDKSTGTFRLTSASFKGRKGKISVDLSSLTSPKKCYERGSASCIGVAFITAGSARKLEQAIVRDPTPDDAAHALICGRQPKSVIKKFAKEASWVLGPLPKPK